MQKPSLGRIVLTYVPASMNNGSDVAPAIITQVCSDTHVNLRVLCDSDNTLHLTSVPLTQVRHARPAPEPGEVGSCWWPPRVE